MNKEEEEEEEEDGSLWTLVFMYRNNSPSTIFDVLWLKYRCFLCLWIKCIKYQVDTNLNEKYMINLIWLHWEIHQSNGESMRRRRREDLGLPRGTLG